MSGEVAGVSVFEQDSAREAAVGDDATESADAAVDALPRWPCRVLQGAGIEASLGAWSDWDTSLGLEPGKPLSCPCKFVVCSAGLMSSSKVGGKTGMRLEWNGRG